MEKQSNNENFSKLGTPLQLLATTALLTTAGISLLERLDRKKKEKAEKARMDYLSYRINPRTMQIERNKNFSIIPTVAGFIGSTAAIIAGERALDHFTSVEFRAKRKISKKHEIKYEKWYKARLQDLKNGLISKAEFSREKDLKLIEKEKGAKEEYDRWLEREELIKESSRDFYNKLQNELPRTENFALFKDLVPTTNKQQPQINLAPATGQSISVSPDLGGFLKLEATKSLLNSGAEIAKNLFFKEDKIKETVKKLMLIELKIDMLKVSQEKKELLKFDAFKEILSKFKNPADVEKIFKLKEQYTEKVKARVKGKNINFEENALDDADFSGWKDEGIH